MRIKVLPGIASAALLVTAIAACGSSSPGNSGDTSGGLSSSKATSYTSVSQLVAAAKKEGGTLNVYMSPEFLFLKADFQKAYPWVKVNFTQLEPPDAATKWYSELNAGVNDVDVVNITPNLLDQFTNLNAVAKVTVPNESLVPTGLMDAGKYGFPVITLPVMLLYNTKLLSAGPEDLSDLSSPQWKNKLVMPDPADGGSVDNLLASERQSMGNAKWMKWLEGIEANSPELTSSGSDAYAAVLRGDREVCVGCQFSDYITQSAGTPVAADYYNQDSTGVIQNDDEELIPVKAPHPATAALFVNWLLSPSGGQEAFAQSGRTPAVPGVVGGDKVSPPAGTKLGSIFGLGGDYFANPSGYTSAFNKVFG